MPPSRAEGLVFLREAARTPGAAAIDWLMAAPSSMGAFADSPMKPRRERIKAIVLGSKEVLMTRSAAPPCLTTPSILAEQENNIINRGIKNRQFSLLRIVIVK